jgi:hypothetical protein
MMKVCFHDLRNAPGRNWNRSGTFSKRGSKPTSIPSASRSSSNKQHSETLPPLR